MRGDRVKSDSDKLYQGQPVVGAPLFTLACVSFSPVLGLFAKGAGTVECRVRGL